MTQDDLLKMLPSFYNKQGNFMASRVPAEAMSLINELTTQCKGNLFERVVWIETGRTDYNKCLTCEAAITKMQAYRENRYATYCSSKCAGASDLTKRRRQETVMKRYGEANVSNVDAINDRRKQTFMERFGGDNPSCSAEIIKKRDNTFKERFGGSSPMASEVVKQKIRQTNLARYGTEYTQQNTAVRAKTVITNIERYGNICSLVAPAIRQKAKATLQANYGVANPLQSSTIRSRMAKTNLDRYGVEHVSQRENHKALLLDARRKNWLMKRLEVIREFAEPLFTSEEYFTVRQDYPWRCLTCGKKFTSHINNGELPKCSFCHPRSLPEAALREWVNSLGIKNIANDRTTIKPYELDIFLPDHNMAIEFNGLYYHAELASNKRQAYHLAKTEQCAARGIALLHIFEDEWHDKPHIIQNILRAKLGKNERISARKCDITQLSPSVAREFLDHHHIQGATGAKVAYGLIYDGNLVSCMTFGKPRFTRHYEWELVRLASIAGTTVVGGASRLLKTFEREWRPSSLVSYADLRLSQGAIYESLGFTLKDITNPGYYYLDSRYRQRHNRMQFQKHRLAAKLPTFDPLLSEWENMQIAGYDRIWDCGQMVWTKQW